MAKLFIGCAWAEGPVYFRDGDYLLWSDIPNNRILRFTPDLSGLGGVVDLDPQLDTGLRREPQRPQVDPGAVVGG